jgi:hypothetical protein
MSGELKGKRPFCPNVKNEEKVFMKKSSTLARFIYSRRHDKSKCSEPVEARSPGV